MSPSSQFRHSYSADGARVAGPTDMRTIFTAVLAILLATSAAGDLIVPQTSSSRILIPIAGETPGAFGTHFRTDISLTNFRDAEQRIALRCLHAARSDPQLPRRQPARPGGAVRRRP